MRRHQVNAGKGTGSEVKFTDEGRRLLRITILSGSTSIGQFSLFGRFLRAAIHPHLNPLLKSTTPSPLLNAKLGVQKVVTLCCKPMPKFVHIQVNKSIIPYELTALNL